MRYTIQDILDRRGISQREMARRTGLDYSYVNRLVNGRFVPRVDKALRLAAALEVQVEDLFALDKAA